MGSIQSIKEVKALWAKELPRVPRPDVRKALALAFLEQCMRATIHFWRCGPLEDISSEDIQRFIEGLKHLKSGYRERLISTVRSSDDHLTVHRACTDEEKAELMQVLVRIVGETPHMSHETAEAFVRAYFFDGPASLQVDEWMELFVQQLRGLFKHPELQELRKELESAVP